MLYIKINTNFKFLAIDLEEMRSVFQNFYTNIVCIEEMEIEYV